MMLLFIFALLLFSKVVLTYRVNHRLPLRELKRRARSGDKNSAAIYKVAANGKAMDTLIYIVGFLLGVYLAETAAGYAWWAVGLLILLIVWLIFLASGPKIGGLLWRFAAWTSPIVFQISSWLMPALGFIAKALPDRSSAQNLEIYEKEDLVELIKAQANRPDNRVPAESLKIAAGALAFGEKLVSSVMTPRRTVRFVTEEDVLGPLLLDELYKTGLSRFPVAKGSAKANMPEITGTLYLRDIVDIGQENKGTVRDHMKRGAYFINEACDLSQALDAVISSHHHQLIVVNNFEEMVGVITLEDILEQIIGTKIEDEFDKYDDLRAVAGHDAKKIRAAHRGREIEPQPKNKEKEAEPEEEVALKGK